jgi:hypothetical protein
LRAEGAYRWVRIKSTAEYPQRRRLGHDTSLLAQQEVDHPAATDVRPLGAAVGEKVGVVATGFLQGICKDGEAVEGS